VVAGSAVLTDEWRQEVPAVLVAWYAGMAGGTALADVLLGRAEPGGRLPFAIPRDEADLPPFDRDATAVRYDAWHGRRRLDRDGVPAAYPLGFGLGYTTVEVAGAEVEVTADRVVVEATLRNTGDRDGGHVVQLYAVRDTGGGQAGAAGPGVDRRLLGFARAEVPAGGERQVRIEAPLRRLARREAPGRWVVEAGSWRLETASHAGAPDAVVRPVTLTSSQV
jgi:beta-glucosidase